MRLVLIVVILFFVCQGLPSCNKSKKNEQEVPEYILSPHKFSKLLVDFAIADCAANMNVKNVPIQKIDSTYAFNPLVDNGIRQSQYDSALDFYSGHPELYKQVYDSVLVMLSEFKATRNNAGSN